MACSFLLLMGSALLWVSLRNVLAVDPAFNDLTQPIREADQYQLKPDATDPAEFPSTTEEGTPGVMRAMHSGSSR